MSNLGKWMMSHPDLMICILLFLCIVMIAGVAVSVIKDGRRCERFRKQLKIGDTDLTNHTVTRINGDTVTIEKDIDRSWIQPPQSWKG